MIKGFISLVQGSFNMSSGGERQIPREIMEENLPSTRRSRILRMKGPTTNVSIQEDS